MELSRAHQAFCREDALPWVALQRRRLQPPSNSFAVGPAHPRPTSVPFLKSCGSAGPVGSATSWTDSGTWKRLPSLAHPPPPSFPLTSRVRTKPSVLRHPHPLTPTMAGSPPASKFPGDWPAAPHSRSLLGISSVRGRGAAVEARAPQAAAEQWPTSRPAAQVSLCFLSCRRGHPAQLSSALLAAPFISVCDSSRAPSAIGF